MEYVMPLAGHSRFGGWSVNGVKQCNRWHHISGRSFVAASNVVYCSLSVLRSVFVFDTCKKISSSLY